MTTNTNKVLFHDSLSAGPQPGWTIAPDHFVEHPQYGPLYLLDWRKKKSGFPLAGDETWRDYRVEMEVLPTASGGFLGLNFHVQPTGDACNFHFPLDGSGRNEALQTGGVWGRSVAWKLFPESQAYALFPAGEWIHLRLDVTGRFANLYAQQSRRPLLTMFDLPFECGGIQLWAYYGSGYFRHLRVTDLTSARVVPAFDNPWDVYRHLDVVRRWQVTLPHKPGFGETDPLEAIASPRIKWVEVESDGRGVVNLSRAFPRKNTKAVVFARATVTSPEKATRLCRFTYTDRLKLWCNGVQVFDGPPRGWDDPDRADHFGGRLIPDEYQARLKLVPGENTILLRSEVTEPWGWGFWLRLDRA